MKVEITDMTRRSLYMADEPIANRIISDMLEDESSPEDYAVSAFRAITGSYCEKKDVLKATAEIAKNCNIWNRYDEDSRDIDVLFDFYVFVPFSDRSFYHIESYLSDIWELDGTEETNAKLIEHSYITRYVEER